MGVARQIGEHGLRTAEWLLCIYHPFGLAQRREEGGECSCLGECGVVAEEREAVGLVRRCEHLQEEPTEQAREHADGEKECRPTSDPALAVVGQTATRYDHVQARMVWHRRAPGVEHGGDADPGAEMLGIGSDRERGLRS